MINRLALCVLLCASIAALTSCGKSESSPGASGSSGAGAGGAGGAGKSITIWWSQWAPSDGLAKLGKDFEKETGIVVNVHQTPWQSYQDQVFQNFSLSKTDF